MITTSAETLFQLLRVAFGKVEEVSVPCDVDWKALIDFAYAQGVAAIAADGLQAIYDARPDIEISLDAPELENDKYDLFGSQLTCEQDYRLRESVVAKVSELWRKAGIDFVILKGSTYARHYPIPENRYSCDLDVMPLNGWEMSNSLLEKAGYSVDRREKKHSKVYIDGLYIENHQYVCGTKGDKEAKRFDRCLKDLLLDGKSDLFHLLFYLKHTQIHFLHEDGIQLKHILDWVFLHRYANEESAALILEFGLDKIADAIDGVAAYVMGESQTLSEPSRIMLDDILTEKHPYSSGGSRFIAHVNILRTIWRRRSLFRVFSYTTPLKLMWTYVYGYIVD